MTMQDYSSKVRDFVDQYNAQDDFNSAYNRLRCEQAETGFKLTAELGNCILWPEQIFQFAHENGLLMYFTAEPAGLLFKPVVTLFPLSSPQQ